MNWEIFFFQFSAGQQGLIYWVTHLSCVRRRSINKSSFLKWFFITLIPEIYSSSGSVEKRGEVQMVELRENSEFHLSNQFI